VNFIVFIIIFFIVIDANLVVELIARVLYLSDLKNQDKSRAVISLKENILF